MAKKYLTLDEAVEQLASTRATVKNLEEAEYYLTRHIIEELERRGATEARTDAGVVKMVTKNTYDPAKLAAMKEYAPEIETAVLTGRWDIDFVALAAEAKADCIQFGWERHEAPHTLLTDDVFRQADDAGLHVMLWHEERPDVIRALDDLPIYGLCGNAPELL